MITAVPMPEFAPFEFDPTAFMSGQVGSKLWLCEQLEPILLKFKTPPPIWILGGWYGMTNFLLQSRDANVGKVTSFDIDPAATKGAMIMNESFVYLESFAAVTADVNVLDYSDGPPVVVNTSAEHMPDRTWFDLIPAGTMVVIQTNNMPHDDHVFAHQNIADLRRDFPLAQYLFSGDLPFKYEDWGFSRFMVIGVK